MLDPTGIERAAGTAIGLTRAATNSQQDKPSTNHGNSGTTMNNSIDLLESIGQDASLRHASSAQMEQTLAERDASDALKQAAMSGDSSLLTRELGAADVHYAVQVHSPAHEDDEESDETDEAQDDDAPEAPNK